jgi:hypothetical protein
MRIAATKSRVVDFFMTKGAVGTKVLLQGAHFMGTMAVTLQWCQRDLQNIDCELYQRNGSFRCENRKDRRN